MLKDDYKKILTIAFIVILIPFIIPIITVLIDVLLNLGRYVGTIARDISNCTY